MTDPDIPSAYVRDKRTPPPTREELRARIPGWGADLDPADRPSYPKLQYPADTGAHWDFPERQPGGEGRERSIEHAFVTPVFGTAQPLRGLSGGVRRFAYRRFSEGRLAHWLLLIVGDRIDAWGSHLRSFASRRPDVPASGLRSELTHGGLRSRRGRSDARHQVLDPVVVAGPWVAGAAVTYTGVRRLVRVLRR
ncbi:hypothetical protein SAMN05660209_03702 [Geodermatophilus africanus]|uniref:Uncharacterized protein n=1 Tax=Geodermatophilus africanus TaxID=1137993 RepID=A0A1H3MNN1_9ACTN|nr:hypothetical protein [Geodermatophilus africanus]SDY78074.1 hypothetical protein SAMN05660209_03702 [Geodermatophilus africanus]